MFTNNDFTNVNMYNYHIDHTLINLNSVNIPGSPAAFGDNVIFKKYPLFADTAAGNFLLLPCSPAVNKGDNAAVNAAGLVTDLGGNPRIFQGIVDMGAYETQDTCQTVGSAEPEGALVVLLSPNPVQAGRSLTVRFVSEQFSEKAYWTVVDLAGKKVGGGLFAGKFDIPAPDIPGGYILQLYDGHTRVQAKFVVLP